ncbi:MAG TPA: hypothetical protein VL527_18495 [Dongiaceae bacterium]|nr:hypothetical protein [Dongiaceae bacterium]
MTRLLLCLLVLASAVSCRRSAPAAQPSLELPPPPTALAAGTVPQSAWYARDAEQALKQHATSTNAAVKKLLGEIGAMKQKLTDAEAAAWQKDPMLLQCDQYIEQTHDWVMKNHAAEFGAQMAYFGATNAPNLPQRQQAASELNDLTHFILFKELSDNSDFRKYMEAAFQAMSQLRQAHPEVPSLANSYFPYWQCDRLIGYPQTAKPAPLAAFADVLRELEKRYPLCLAKVTQIQREQNIPAPVIAGLKYGNLYRMLDGAAEFYLEVRTPPALAQLREDLRHKIIELSHAEP